MADRNDRKLFNQLQLTDIEEHIRIVSTIPGVDPDYLLALQIQREDLVEEVEKNRMQAREQLAMGLPEPGPSARPAARPSIQIQPVPVPSPVPPPVAPVPATIPAPVPAPIPAPAPAPATVRKRSPSPHQATAPGRGRWFWPAEEEPAPRASPDNPERRAETPATARPAAQPTPARRGRPRVEKECGACFDVFRAVDMTRLECDHHYCRPCLKDMFEASMLGGARFPPQCCGEVPLEVAQNVLDGEAIKRYMIKLEEVKAEDALYCSNPRCSRLIPDTAKDKAAERGECPHCGAATCLMCRQKAHTGDCPEDEGLNQLLETADGEFWKRCPRCRTMICWNGGCRHMSCHTCWWGFCFVCLNEWNPTEMLAALCPYRLNNHDDELEKIYADYGYAPPPSLGLPTRPPEGFHEARRQGRPVDVSANQILQGPIPPPPARENMPAFNPNAPVGPHPPGQPNIVQSGDAEAPPPVAPGALPLMPPVVAPPGAPPIPPGALPLQGAAAPAPVAPGAFPLMPPVVAPPGAPPIPPGALPLQTAAAPPNAFPSTAPQNVFLHPQMMPMPAWALPTNPPPPPVPGQGFLGIPPAGPPAVQVGLNGQPQGPQLAGPQFPGPQFSRPPIPGPQLPGPQLPGPHLLGPQVAGPQPPGQQPPGPQFGGPQLTGIHTAGPQPPGPQGALWFGI